MLMQSTASARSTGQAHEVASRSCGGRTFARPSCAIQAAIESRMSASGSVGCQVNTGIRRAKCATCCPVPLAISSTRPRCGRTRRSTSRIGPLFRSAAGKSRRPSGQRSESGGSMVTSSHRILCAKMRSVKCMASLPARLRPRAPFSPTRRATAQGGVVTPERTVMKRVAIALVLLLAAGAYVASPFWTLWRLGRALEARDSWTIVSHIDFPSLRESLSLQLTAAHLGGPRTGLRVKQTNVEFVLAPKLVDSLVGQLVTPAGVRAALENGWLDRLVGAGPAGPSADAGVSAPGA